MNLRSLWNLQDTELLSELVPSFAYSPGDHYPNPWVLGRVRLMLVFPFLTDDERNAIQTARLAVEEFNILLEGEESYLTAQEREDYRTSLRALQEEYRASMETVRKLTEKGRLTEAQEELLASELRLELAVDDAGSFALGEDGGSVEASLQR